VVTRNPDLPQVIRTLHASRRRTGRLNRGQQQANEHADDGQHHQQLSQRESGAMRP
jgi:hypothetical protein